MAGYTDSMTITLREFAIGDYDAARSGRKNAARSGRKNAARSGRKNAARSGRWKRDAGGSRMRQEILSGA